MNAARTIPGRPVQTGTAAARKAAGLVAQCLDATSGLDEEAVAAELDRAVPYLAHLINAGHLAEHELVLVAAKLRLSLAFPVGARALDAEENLTPARGAATAGTWRLHIPAPLPYDDLLRDLCETSDHLTLDPAPDTAPATEAGSDRSLVDLEAFRRAAKGR